MSLLILHLPAMLFTPYAVLLLYCAALICFGLVTLREANAGRAWPTAAGRVTKSLVAEEASLDFTDLSESVKPDISYEYEVDGRRYAGNLLKEGDQYKTRMPWFVRRWLKRYQVGAAIEVHYRPGSPAESMIYPRPVLPWLLPLSGGCLFSLIVVAMFREAYAANPAFYRWNFLTLGIGAGLFIFFAVMIRKESP